MLRVRRVGSIRRASSDYHLQDVDVYVRRRRSRRTGVGRGRLRKPLLKFDLGLIQDSGERSVVRVVQARLVDGATGKDLSPPVTRTTYHESFWDANQETPARTRSVGPGSPVCRRRRSDISQSRAQRGRALGVQPILSAGTSTSRFEAEPERWDRRGRLCDRFPLY